MPFQSEKQRRYLWMHEPEVAKKWTKKYGSKPQTAKPKMSKKAERDMRNGYRTTHK